MVYTYDEKHKRVKSVKVPRLTGSDAERVEKAKVPKAFLKSVMAMKLNVVNS